jgi:hypothetical protein
VWWGVAPHIVTPQIRLLSYAARRFASARRVETIPFTSHALKSFPSRARSSTIEGMSEKVPAMPGSRIFRHVLESEWGTQRTTDFMLHAQERFAAYYHVRPQFKNRAVQKTHFENSILPGMVLYQSLLAENMDREAALELAKKCISARVASRRRANKLLGKFPFFYALLRLALRLQIRLEYPPEGWKLEWTVDSSESIGINMYSCIYLNTLTQYGVPELTPVFCQLDDLLLEGISPFVRWQRTQTLGTGGTLCDFRFYRGKKPTHIVLKPLL